MYLYAVCWTRPNAEVAGDAPEISHKPRLRKGEEEMAKTNIVEMMFVFASSSSRVKIEAVEDVLPTEQVGITERRKEKSSGFQGIPSMRHAEYIHMGEGERQREGQFQDPTYPLGCRIRDLIRVTAHVKAELLAHSP
jgi:hypothetical protein